MTLWPDDCPKCANSRLEALKPSMSSMWRIHCLSCGHSGEKAPKKESAIILWNAAAAEPVQ